jgi:BirA family transcriptional regulator, biotin operon repressor / biotin---[acetyl-CoA-carboxylase] ligase
MMEEILKILKENRGAYVSGEMLAQSSGITRAAIWKHMVHLREIGYLIESSPSKGYRLLSLTPVLHPFEIKDGLSTTTFGQVIYDKLEVDSTSKWAKALANEGAVEGTLVIAESQTSGRGRIGRSWASAPGLGLWFHLILRPQISTSALAGITLLTAVTMAKAIQQVTGVQAKIKWPNDLTYNGRKLAGILAELNGEMDLVNYLVLGIGVNVNHSVSDFPAELAELATSLNIIKQEQCSRRLILQEFLKEFELAYYALPESGMSKLHEYAKKHSATLGKLVKIAQGAGRFVEGEAVDLELDGSLLIKGVNGGITRIYSGDLIEVGEVKEVDS